MGGSLEIKCHHCGLEASAPYGPGRIGIEFVPCVCRRCREIVSHQRVFAPMCPTDEQLHYFREEFGVEIDPPLLCEHCASPIEMLLSEDQPVDGSHVVAASCPRCGNSLTVDEGFLLWD